jgi:hypothetical protein
LFICHHWAITKTIEIRYSLNKQKQVDNLSEFNESIVFMIKGILIVKGKLKVNTKKATMVRSRKILVRLYIQIYVWRWLLVFCRDYVHHVGPNVIWIPGKEFGSVASRYCILTVFSSTIPWFSSETSQKLSFEFKLETLRRDRSQWE